MTSDLQAAEIEAVIEKDKQQLRRKVRIACVCMGALGAAAVIGAVFCFKTLSDSGVSFFSDLSALRFVVLGMIAGSWPYLYCRIEPRHKVIRATIVALSLTLMLAIFWGWRGWGPVLLGVSFLVVFLVSICVDAVGSRSSKSEQC